LWIIPKLKELQLAISDDIVTVSCGLSQN